jgi:hypothetical protein
MACLSRGLRHAGLDMASHAMPAVQAPTSLTGQSVDELIFASQSLDDGTMRTQLSVPDRALRRAWRRSSASLVTSRAS